MKFWLDNIERIDVKPRPGGIDLRYSEWTKKLKDKLFKKFLKTLTWEDFALYPDTNILKSKLASHHGVDISNIYLGPGSSECIKNVFDCFDSMQSVMSTEPCFPMYDVYAKQNNLFMNKADVEFRYEADRIQGCSFIVFSRPSNPIGFFLKREDVIEILKANPMRWVLVDEAYVEYVKDKDSIIDLIDQYDNLIVSRSFSKVFGAAGCRIGYLISNKKNIETISKFRQMYEISGPAQKYAIFLLDNYSVVQKYCKKTISERKKLCKLFRSAKLCVLPSEGNWIHVEQTELLLDILKNNNIHAKENIILPNRDCKWIRLTVGPGITKLFEEFIH